MLYLSTYMDLHQKLDVVFKKWSDIWLLDLFLGGYNVFCWMYFIFASFYNFIGFFSAPKVFW